MSAPPGACCRCARRFASYDGTHDPQRGLAPAVLVIAIMLTSSGRADRVQGTSPGMQFTDVTTAAGITFRHQSGAFGKKYLPETMGSGGAFLDVDGDGWQDLLLRRSRGLARPAEDESLSRRSIATTATARSRTSRAASGLAVEMYGMGVAAADYDNDGDADLYLTALGPNRLFRNDRGGRFEDVTAQAGVGDPGFSTSAAVVRLRPRRPARPVRRQLRRVVDREGSVSARSTARASRTARRRRTRARVRRSTATRATARSRTSPAAPASTIRRTRCSASR